MSKAPTLASVSGPTLSGAQQKAFNIAVLNALNSAGMQEGARTPLTANTSLTVSQCGLVLVDCTAGNVTLTLPASGDTTDDAIYWFRRVDSTTNACSVQKSGSDTIEGASSAVSIPPKGMLAMQMPADLTDWRLLWFGGGTQSAARLALGIGAGADIASASTLNLTARTGSMVRITGTTATTAVTMGNGDDVTCIAVAAWPLTYHATNMPLPGGVSYTCTAGDQVNFKKDNSGVLTIDIVKKDGTSVVSGSGKLASVGATVNANALTVTIAGESLDFRSSTLGSGASVTRTAPDGSLVVPSGATLGTVSGVKARLVWGWIDNAGTLEPFIVNLGSGVILDEQQLISTTAISAGSGSSNVFYSAVARSNVAYRVRGSCEITQAVAGTHASNPTLVSGQGGNSLAGLPKMLMVPPVSTASGTAVDMSNLPSWAREVVYNFNSVSWGTIASTPVVRLGDASGVKSSGYATSTNTLGVSDVNVASGFPLSASISAASTLQGQVRFSLADPVANTWAFISMLGYSDSANFAVAAGTVSLASLLTIIRLTNVNGTDTLDGGSVSATIYGF